MIQPPEEVLDELQDSTKAKLKTMREPNYAYVMLERIKSCCVLDGKNTKVECRHGIRIINLENQPDQLPKIQKAIERENQKLISWGNFPKVNDTDPARQKKRSFYVDEYATTSWDTIDAYLLQRVNNIKNGGAVNKKLASEVEQLRAELAAQEAALKAKGKQ